MPVVICQLASGESMITEKGVHGLDEPQHRDADLGGRHRQGLREDVFRRVHSFRISIPPGAARG